MGDGGEKRTAVVPNAPAAGLPHGTLRKRGTENKRLSLDFSQCLGEDGWGQPPIRYMLKKQMTPASSLSFPGRGRAKTGLNPWPRSPRSDSVAFSASRNAISDLEMGAISLKLSRSGCMARE